MCSHCTRQIMMPRTRSRKIRMASTVICRTLYTALRQITTQIPIEFCTLVIGLDISLIIGVAQCEQTISHLQGSYRVLLKSTCVFLCFFQHLWLFSWNFLKSAFFGQKCAFFSVEPPIFSQKYHYFEGFGHKETFFFFKICYSMLISLKTFSALLHLA